jgi:hypothetical protein
MTNSAVRTQTRDHPQQRAELLTGVEGAQTGAEDRAAGRLRGLGAPRAQHHAETGGAHRQQPRDAAG